MKPEPQECFRCRNLGIVFWADVGDIICENCLGCRPESPESKNNSRILFYPTLTGSGQWANSHHPTFGDLRQFIDECLRPNTSKVFKPFLVRKYETLSALIHLLHTKRTESKRAPQYLAAKSRIAELKKLLELQKARAGVEIPPLRQRMRELDQIIQRENPTSLREPFKQKWRSLEAEIAAKEDEMQKLRSEIAIQQSLANQALKDDGSSIQLHAIQRLIKDLELWSRGALVMDFAIPVRRVYWKLLKPSGDTWAELVRHFEHLSRTRQERYEIERLKFAYDIGPKEIFVGSESFEGYVVFIFPKVKTALLDCPKVGNAVYMMDSENWRLLSQFSKTDLLDHHRNEVKRIIHSQYWQFDIKKEFENRVIALRTG